MLRNERREQKDAGLSLGLFNPSNPTNIEALNALIEAEIARKDNGNKHFTQTFMYMVEWLKKYVNNPDFLSSSYSYRRSLELVAEATFWSVKLGLEPHLAKMNYTEIRNFNPLKESSSRKTECSNLIHDVYKKLAKPAWLHEASYALSEAAFCIYVHHHSFEKLKEEKRLYEEMQSLSKKSRL